LPVQLIDVGLVMKVLEPLWNDDARHRVKAPRADGKHSRLGKRARKYRSGDNPAIWRGGIESLLPKATKVRKVKHHAALPYAEIAEFMATLRARHRHRGARSRMVNPHRRPHQRERSAPQWSEIDFKGRVWVIPADRMKADKEHRVPLSEPAMALLAALSQDGPYLFASERFKSQHLSSNGMFMLLQRMGRGDITVHGFRSTFRDWVGEVSSFDRDLGEMALAHAVGDETEQAYRRGDGFDKRRRLMDAWADHCAGIEPAAGDNVTLLRRA
jgi:integrase